MTLAAAVVAFIEARAAIQAACPEARKFSVIHGGKGYFFNVDPVQGVGVAVSDALATDGAADAAPAADKPKRGRPAKEAPIAGPGSTTPATGTDTPAATVTDAAAPMTKDKYRALAREVASVIGIEAVKAIHGQRAIDTIPAAEYAGLVEKLDAAKKESGQL